MSVEAFEEQMHRAAQKKGYVFWVYNGYVGLCRDNYDMLYIYRV